MSPLTIFLCISSFLVMLWVICRAAIRGAVALEKSAEVLAEIREEMRRGR